MKKKIIGILILIVAIFLGILFWAIITNKSLEGILFEKNNEDDSNRSEKVKNINDEFDKIIEVIDAGAESIDGGELGDSIFSEIDAEI